MPGDIVPDNMIAPAYKSHGLLINGQRATLLLDHIFIDHIYSNVPRTSRLASGSEKAVLHPPPRLYRTSGRAVCFRFTGLLPGIA
jgi:hypothetical protein